MKTRRNISRIACNGTCSHRPWGGNFGGQDGPRDLIGHRQPADALAGGQRDILHGVDLPDLVGMDRLGDHHDGRAAAPGPMDSGPDESDLEAAHRGDGSPMGVRAELESDQPGAPGGMVPLDLAGDPEQLTGAGGDGAPLAAIVRGESLKTPAAVESPDLPDRAVGDGQVRGDLGQREALLMTAHDLLTERDRERLRHGSRLQEPATGNYRLTRAHVTNVHKQRHGFLRIAWRQPYCA
jgi:hypothetical protein